MSFYVLYVMLTLLNNIQFNTIETEVFRNSQIFYPEQAKFNHLDKFLLQKLYSDDFEDQFKDLYVCQLSLALCE